MTPEWVQGGDNPRVQSLVLGIVTGKCCLFLQQHNFTPAEQTMDHSICWVAKAQSHGKVAELLQRNGLTAIFGRTWVTHVLHVGGHCYTHFPDLLSQCWAYGMSILQLSYEPCTLYLFQEDRMDHMNPALCISFKRIAWRPSRLSLLAQQQEKPQYRPVFCLNVHCIIESKIEIWALYVIWFTAFQSKIL